ncbi:helix-turn-helix domain-containing protein [Patulibacter medicamentivorans]|uniref:helix-turn-helix domain-containing protein n=1 Tax=Patulibacter medicamentivorans TaxID=1097667 RepID=UPI00068155C1|nr:helix-turn-helix transcriptional regulator [Patulibacter medicamentivorans]
MVDVANAATQFGRKVRAARRARDWTQEDLAAASGLAVVQISRIERGVREVRLTTILKLLAALDGPIEDLIDADLVAAVR